jgi:hypothetical protein
MRDEGCTIAGILKRQTAPLKLSSISGRPNVGIWRVK